jgi:L-seryl-tRNA(Ser) seleniumtransferase
MPSGLGNFPSINELLESPPLKSLVNQVNPTRMMNSVRSFVDGMRQEVQNAVAQRQIPSPLALAEQIAQWIMRQEQAGVRSVLNGTGILLHPELGGAPLADEALAAMRDAAGSYSRVSSGPGKATQVEQLLQKLIGCEAAFVASNPALAISVLTNVLGCGREVLIPRQQMATAVDGTRTFDLIASAGGRIREVGSANELTSADLTAAQSGESAFLFWQQGLAYATTGFGQTIELGEAATWASRRALPLIVDLGIGGCHDCVAFGLEPQPTAAAALSAGASAVILRGDGLLGGPPCAVIAGKSSLLARISSHPLARAAAGDKYLLAALEATLELHQATADPNGISAERSIPLLGLLATSADNLKHRAERLAPQLAASPAFSSVEPRTDFAYLTAAKLPAERLPTWGLALQPGTPGKLAAQGTAADLLAALGNTTPAIVGSLAGDRVWLDLRAISPREDQQLVLAVEQLAAK